MCSACLNASLVVSGEWEWAFSDVAVGPSHPWVLPDSPSAGHLSQERLAAGQVHSLHQCHSLCYSWRRHRENFTGSVFLTSTFLIEVLGFVCVLLCLLSIISLGNDWTELAGLAELYMNSLYCRGWYSSKTFLHFHPSPSPEWSAAGMWWGWTSTGLWHGLGGFTVHHSNCMSTSLKQILKKIPGRSSRRIFFFRADCLSWHLFLYLSPPPPPHLPCVTAVACKISCSFCQKCRWQVTAAVGRG